MATKNPQVAPNQSSSSNQPGRKLTPRQLAAQQRIKRRQRMQILITGAVVAVLALIAIAIAVVASQPTKFSYLPAQVTADERPGEWGPVDAKVTIEAFTDFQCPACKLWHSTVFNNLQTDYITAGKSVKLVTSEIGFLDTGSSFRESHVTAEAAECASEQKRYANYSDALYQNQPPGENTGFWTTNRVKELAKLLQLDTAKFDACVDSNKYRQQVNTDTTAALNRGVAATPTIFVNGKSIAGNDYAEVKKAIEEALNTPAK